MDSSLLNAFNRFIKLARPYLLSEKRQQALILLSGLLVFALASTGMFIVISYQERNMSTALSEKDQDAFYASIRDYFIVICIAVPFFAFYNYLSDYFAYRWREWLTLDIISSYLQYRAFYNIHQGFTLGKASIDNPDQRIAQDINSFTTQSVKFILLLIQQCFQIIGFAGVLYSISPSLVAFLVSYAAVGTFLATTYFGKKLIPINRQLLKTEADFRYSLVRLGENSESIAFYHGEEQEQEILTNRFQKVLDSVSELLFWQRNMSLFQNSYLYITYLLPSLIIAPAYFSGEVEFGVVSQAGMAFRMIMSAVSIVVSQFKELSQFAAGIDRLYHLVVFLDEHERYHEMPGGHPMIFSGERIRRVYDDVIGPCLIILENVQICTPARPEDLQEGELSSLPQVLISRLNLEITQSTRLLITGVSGVGKSSLLRTVAGLWSFGKGKIIINKQLIDSSKVMFLPQKPYMTLGTLKDQLCYPYQVSDFISDDVLEESLTTVGLSGLADRVGGLHIVREWEGILSIGEQQRLAFARIIIHQPMLVFLDEATSALDEENQITCYELLQSLDISYVSVGHRHSLFKFHESLLSIESSESIHLTSLAH